LLGKKPHARGTPDFPPEEKIADPKKSRARPHPCGKKRRQMIISRAADLRVMTGQGSKQISDSRGKSSFSKGKRATLGKVRLAQS